MSKHPVMVPTPEGGARVVKVSDVMLAALELAEAHGHRLCYHAGGFWSPFVPGSRTMCWRHDWYTTKQTVRALVDRGLMRWSKYHADGYPIEAEQVK